MKHDFEFYDEKIKDLYARVQDGLKSFAPKGPSPDPIIFKKLQKIWGKIGDWESKLYTLDPEAAGEYMSEIEVGLEKETNND